MFKAFSMVLYLGLKHFKLAFHLEFGSSNRALQILCQLWYQIWCYFYNSQNLALDPVLIKFVSSIAFADLINIFYFQIEKK